MKKIILITGLMISMAIHSAHAQEKIRVGQGSISLQSGLMHIAKDRGLFTKYGLVTETIYIPGGSWNITNNAVTDVTGQVDVGTWNDQAGNHPGSTITYQPPDAPLVPEVLRLVE